MCGAAGESRIPRARQRNDMSKITSKINRISLAVISFVVKLVFYALVVMLLIIGARQSYAFGHSIFYAPAMEEAPGTAKTVTLTGDESVHEVGKLLKEAGLIRDDLAFTVQAFCYEYKVKAGTYELNTASSSKDLINILAAGTETED